MIAPLPLDPQQFQADADACSGGQQAHPVRVSSRTLLGNQRMIEIEHAGRVYQLRLTQLNKLILTA